MSMNGQLPPNAVDLEEALLGCLLMNPDDVLEIDDRLRGRHFFSSKNQDVFEAIQEVFAETERTDITLVAEKLRQQKTGEDSDKLSDFGGEASLIGLVQEVTVWGSANTYADKIVEMAKRRALITHAGRVATAAYDTANDLDTAIVEAETGLYSLSSNGRKKEPATPHEHTTRTLEAIEYEGQGVMSGFRDIDTVTTGMHPNFLYVLAGATGMGKSALAISLIDLVLEAEMKVLMFSLEMSAVQVDKRILSYRTGVPTLGMRTSLMPDVMRDKVYKEAGRLGEQNLFIDDTTGITAGAIRSKARRSHLQNGLDLIVVDHLHLMRPDRNLGSRYVEVGENSLSMAEMARELETPVLLLSQLNRAAATRRNKRPTLADLRDSGDIEQNAYAVWLMYRDAYYNNDSDRPGICEVNIAKHREGPTRVVDLGFDEMTAHFRTLERQEPAVAEHWLD